MGLTPLIISLKTRGPERSSQLSKDFLSIFNAVSLFS